MTTVAVIVEGYGEVAAVPILIRRLAAAVAPDTALAVRTPIRVQRDRFLRKAGELERYVQLAHTKPGARDVS